MKREVGGTGDLGEQGLFLLAVDVESGFWGIELFLKVPFCVGGPPDSFFLEWYFERRGSVVLFYSLGNTYLPESPFLIAMSCSWLCDLSLARSLRCTGCGME